MLVCYLASCSKKSEEISVSNGSIIYGDNVLDLDELSVDTAKQTLQGVGEIEYYTCTTTDHCPHNTSNIYEEDMSEYKGCKYYSIYLDTEIYVYVPDGKDNYIEAKAVLDPNVSMEVLDVVKLIYNQAKLFHLTETKSSIDFEGILKFKPNGYAYKVRRNEIIIPDLLRISKDNSKKPETSVQVGKLTFGKTSNSRFDYYVGYGVTVQVVSGTDIEPFIEVINVQSKE